MALVRNTPYVSIWIEPKGTHRLGRKPTDISRCIHSFMTRGQRRSLLRWKFLRKPPRAYNLLKKVSNEWKKGREGMKSILIVNYDSQVLRFCCFLYRKGKEGKRVELNVFLRLFVRKNTDTTFCSCRAKKKNFFRIHTHSSNVSPFR